LSDKRIGLQGATAVALGELYDLVSDLGETTNLADAQPQVVERLLALADRAREDLGDGSTPGKHQRPVGRVADPKPQLLAD
jgi:hypothetical protein